MNCKPNAFQKRRTLAGRHIGTIGNGRRFCSVRSLTLITRKVDLRSCEELENWSSLCGRPPKSATPIFLVTPLTMQIKLGFRPESGIAGTIMWFNDAKAYPQLYRNETRSDSGHLNSVAAKEFTRIVAESFSQLRRENRIQ